MKILGPNDSGKGILVEWDAGIINPNEHRNSQVIKESYGQLDHSKPFVFYATLQKYGVPNRKKQKIMGKCRLRWIGQT